MPGVSKPSKKGTDGQGDPTSVGDLCHQTGAFRSRTDWVLFNPFPGAKEFWGLEGDLGSQATQQLHCLQTLQNAIPQIDLGLHKGRRSADIGRPQRGLLTCSHSSLPLKVPAIHIRQTLFSISGHAVQPLIGPQDLHKIVSGGSCNYQIDPCQNTMLL